MANLVVGGIIATVVFIAIGIVLILPPYVKGAESKTPSVLLSFSINGNQNTPQWCQGIAELLNKNQLKGIVFFSGKAAEQYPDCVKAFNDEVDIGSSTYSFTKLSAERDYLDQLEDVRKGKAAVDSVAGVDSKSFQAPYDYTDDNVHSLLSRNNITADFSGNGSYNKYDGVNFILHPLKTFDLDEFSISEIESQIASKAFDHVRIRADSSVPVEKVATLIDAIKNEAIFVNASEVAEMELTGGR